MRSRACCVAALLAASCAGAPRAPAPTPPREPEPLAIPEPEPAAPPEPAASTSAGWR